MNNLITSKEETRRLIEERRYKYFTFPELGLTVQYRKPDMLQLALNNSLPATLADIVIESYKLQMKGADTTELQKRGANLELDNELLTQLRGKSFEMLTNLVTSHRILNVPESDIDNDVISWKDVPEVDAMGFLMHVIYTAQTSETEGGGEVQMKDLETFPNGKQVSKRNSPRKNRQNVRKAAQ